MCPPIVEIKTETKQPFSILMVDIDYPDLDTKKRSLRCHWLRYFFSFPYMYLYVPLEQIFQRIIQRVMD